MSNPSPIQSKLLSKINERLVLKLIQDRGPSTRAEMSKSIGITFPTVAKAVATLLESKLLEEVEESTTGPGRPAKLLRLANENAQVIGVALAVSECTVASAGLNGIVHSGSCVTFPTPKTYDSLLVHITRHVKKLMPPDGKSTLIIGISMPAVIDYEAQRSVFSANMPILTNESLGKDLEAMLGIECLILKDTHALALSEQAHSASEEVTNFAILDLCRGVGLGLMAEGQFLTGNSGFAGELGHTAIVPGGDVCHCGKKGCLETVASEWALEARISLVMRRPVKINEILEMAQEGNQQVLLELEAMCGYLAIGVAHVVNLMNPGTFYIHGRVFQACPQLFDLVVEKTEQYAMDFSFNACNFVRATGGVLEGTIASVIDYLTDSRVPDLEGYVRFAGITMNRSLATH